MFATRNHVDIFLEGEDQGPWPGLIEVGHLGDHEHGLVLRVTSQVSIFVGNLAQAEALEAAAHALADDARRRAQDEAA